MKPSREAGTPERKAETAPVRREDQRAPAIPGDAGERRWQQMQRELKLWWPCLTEEDVLQVGGRRDVLLSVLNEKYGYASQRADEELAAALRSKPRQ